ncbi:MAG: TonB-dependent receptor [Chitinophagaceae bacterium]|nr:MAG: TonB-dependent receptor [Chitinophagaceae bacterium]
MRKFFVVTALFISSQLTAQTDSSRTLNPIVVTASKFPQKQSSTGKVVSVITKEQIEKGSGRTIAQLLNEQAGLSINGALNVLGSNQTVSMRGSSAGRTLILLDGIPVNDPTLINNEFDLNLISLNNVERIEVCRGAQSTLYGSDAVAGVVNIITMKNDIAKPFHVKATLSGGNFGTFRGNVQAFGKIGKLNYITRYGKLNSKGFSAAYDSTGTKGFDNDKYNSDVASAALQYAATENLSFRGFTQYSRYNNDLDAGVFADEKDFSIKNKSMMAGGGFQYRKENVTLRGNYQYSDISRNYRNDSLDMPGFTKFSTDDYYGKNQFVEFYSSIGIAKGLTFLQGGDYRYNTMRSQLYSLSSFGPFTSQFKDTSHSQGSVYASLFYHTPNEKFNVELGGRLNAHSRYGSNYTYTFNPSYSFTEHFRVFGNLATGFKAPTLYQLYSSYRPLTGVLNPETSKTIEAGVQQTHEKLQTRLLYFHRKIENGLDFNYVTFRYYNFIKQDVGGIEAEATWQPITGLNISGNYTYLHAKEVSQGRINYKDTTYNYLLRRPKHNVNLTAGYQVKNGPFISVSGKYVSDRYDVGGYQLADVLLNSYFLMNAYAEYQLGPLLKVFADAQNITNKKFFDVRGYNSIPFIFNGGITISWP